jgi:uncharacterized protein YggT (Ycf19 family)
MTEVTTREEVVYEAPVNGEVIPAQPVTAVEEIHYTYDEADGRRFIPWRLYKVDQLIWLALIVLEVMIGMRIFLKLIAANPASGFASFVYTITEPFLAPFAGLTSTPSANGAVLEIPSIIAMIVYALLFWLLAYLVHLIWER